MDTVVEYGFRRTIVVIAVMLAAVLQLADTTIVNVALPTIDGSLGASTTEGTWFVTAYIIANIVVIPLSPFLSGLLGRKRYFVISIAGFTIMSALCGMATDTSSEIFYRFLQGAFGGGLMVPAQQIMRDTFPPEELGTSQSLFGLAVVLGPTIGPTLGGVLTDALSWNWVFFINLVPGVLAALLAFFFIRDPQTAQKSRIDIWGVSLLAVGLGALQYVLEEGERNDWFSDAGISICSLASVVCLSLFIWWELRTPNPAVVIRVLGQRAVAAAVAISFVGGFVLYGLFIIQPQFTQAELCFTTTLSGLFMMVRAATILVLYPITTWVVSRKNLDLRLVVGFGLTLYSIGSLWLGSLTTTTANFAAFIPAQMLGGVGLAFFFVPLNVALLRALSPAHIAPALALQRLFQQLGGSLASAILLTYADRRFVDHDAGIRASLALHRPAPQALLEHFHSIHVGMSTSIHMLAHLVSVQDEALALADATYVVGVVGLIAVPLIFVFKRQQRT
jgi:DHA2 family multidrug resistance protein